MSGRSGENSFGRYILWDWSAEDEIRRSRKLAVMMCGRPVFEKWSGRSICGGVVEVDDRILLVVFLDLAGGFRVPEGVRVT